jgi:NitT/TauT family transport system substrate-binding protein
MMFRRRFRGAVAALLVALWGCPSVIDAQQTPAPPLIRIATSASETYAQAFFAQDIGLYQKAGLNVEVDTLGTGAAVSSAVAGGGADVGVATMLNLANAIARGVPFVVIAPAAMETAKQPSGLLCVGKTSPYKTAKDFDGQTIAIPALKQTVDLAVREWLTQGGGDPAKVHIIEAPFSEMGPAVERGTYAAAAISEPSLSQAQRGGGIRCIGDPYSAIAPNYLLGAWFTTKDFAAKNPAVVKKIADALTAAGKWANAHHFESAAIVSKVNKVDVDTIRAEVRPRYAEGITLSEIQPQLDAGYKFGFLTRQMSADKLLGSASR